MIGKKVPTSKLFYQFSLEERVPADHLLRRVAAAVDFSFVRRLTKRFYSHTGQPSVDPVVIFKMALLGYLYGITSERRLVQEIQLNLAYLWFIGYDLDEPVPDHSVLSKARARFGPTVYLGFFKEIVRQCEQAGLVRGNKLYVDSTLVEADANRDGVASRVLVAQLADVQAHVDKLWQDNADSPTSEDDSTLPRPTPLHPVPAVAVPAEGLAAADVAQSEVGSPLPSVANEPRSTPPETVAEPMGEEQPQDGAPVLSLHVAGPSDVPNKAVGLLNERMVSRVDPEAEVVQRARVLARLYYKVHIGVDAGRARIVTAVEATGGGIADEYLLERIIREHEGNVGRHLAEVVADTKYGTVDNYRRLEELGIRASIPMRENSAENRAVPPSAFTYDQSNDSFVCPEGQRLTRQGVTTKTAVHPLVIYRARPKECASCRRKVECCGKAKARSVSRPDDGGLRDRMEAYLRTFAAQQSIRRRKVWVETIFGDGKERRGMRRADCRGLDWMRVQAFMIAIAQNVRQLALRKKIRPESGVAAMEKDFRAADFDLLGCLSSIFATNDHFLTPKPCPN